eukprot:CAMPEP_0117560850 /NCGR_PEP_ID=MMETSP0784-20121206/54092_1 /TAXON_ID=39447 /ORGANISM="" /LENGTH=433 /DNA_ID=CAMNT_0005358279 /DNA_START=123 /DNA_END=1427 /DNA_ORIENTATION=-
MAMSDLMPSRILVEDQLTKHISKNEFVSADPAIEAPSAKDVQRGELNLFDRAHADFPSKANIEDEPPSTHADFAEASQRGVSRLVGGEAAIEGILAQSNVVVMQDLSSSAHVAGATSQSEQISDESASSSPRRSFGKVPSAPLPTTPEKTRGALGTPAGAAPSASVPPNVQGVSTAAPRSNHGNLGELYSTIVAGSDLRRLQQCPSPMRGARQLSGWIQDIACSKMRGDIIERADGTFIKPNGEVVKDADPILAGLSLPTRSAREACMVLPPGDAPELRERADGTFIKPNGEVVKDADPILAGLSLPTRSAREACMVLPPGDAPELRERADGTFIKPNGEVVKDADPILAGLSLPTRSAREACMVLPPGDAPELRERADGTFIKPNGEVVKDADPILAGLSLPTRSAREACMVLPPGDAPELARAGRWHFHQA